LPDYAEKRSNKDGDIHQRHSKHIWEEHPLCQGVNAKDPAYVRKRGLAVHSVSEFCEYAGLDEGNMEKFLDG